MARSPRSSVPVNKIEGKTIAPGNAVDEVNARVSSEVARRARVVRNFPASPLEEALAFAKQVFEFGSGEPVRRLSLFDHIGKMPESGTSRMLITNAGKYGLIKGGYSSDLM